jgi:hypothetical protein
MKFTLPALAAFAAPAVLAQTTTQPPFTPPWATSDLGKWSSVYNSLVSDGKIPSTLTAAPWPLERLVDAQRLAVCAVDGLVGRQRLPGVRLARLDRRALGHFGPLDHLVWLHGEHHGD